MRWRRIIDSTAFALAVLVFLLVPFVVSRMLAKYIFRRLERVQQQLYLSPARQTPRSRTASLVQWFAAKVW
jgi:hypothetical protein